MGSSSYNRYDKSGHRTGTSKRDLWGGGYTHYDAKGRKTGSSRENLFGGGYTHYDVKGKKVGSSSRQVFGSGYNNYDAKGRKTGSSNRQVFGGGYTHYDTKGNKTGTSNEGCYIATCIYGSYDCPEVLILRRFRDSVLKHSALGRSFIRVYYAISPKLVRWLGHTKCFRILGRKILNRMITNIQQRFNNKNC